MKKHWIPFLLAFVLPLVLIFWWWGGFNQARFELAQRGPYHYAYMPQKGDYYKLPEKQQEVLNLLKQQGVPAGARYHLAFERPPHYAQARLERPGGISGRCRDSGERTSGHGKHTCTAGGAGQG
jgi:hypothetical protein